MGHLIELANALGDTASAATMTAAQAELIADFNTAWLQAGGYYGSSPTDGAQTAQACALGLGIVPPAQVEAITSYLVNDITANHGGYLSVGIIGQKYLSRALTATGNAYLAANISLQTGYPSFGWTFNHPIEPAT